MICASETVAEEFVKWGRLITGLGAGDALKESLSSIDVGAHEISARYVDRGDIERNTEAGKQVAVNGLADARRTVDEPARFGRHLVTAPLLNPPKRLHHLLTNEYWLAQSSSVKPLGIMAKVRKEDPGTGFGEKDGGTGFFGFTGLLQCQQPLFVFK